MNANQVKTIDEAAKQVCRVIGQNPDTKASLSNKLKPVIDKALSDWQGCEQMYLETIGKSREEVFEAFHAFHNKMLVAPLDDDLLRMESPQWLCKIESSLPVMNVSWINAFVRILPVVDRNNAPRYIHAGQMMTVSFFYRHVCGHGREGDCYEFPINLGEHLHFRNIERLYIEAFWGDLAQDVRIEDYKMRLPVVE